MEASESSLDDFKKVKSSSDGLILKTLKACLPITVEPILFLVLFSSNLKAITNVTLTMEMVCSTEKNFSGEICRNFLVDEKYIKEKIIIQQSSNNWGVVNTLVSVLPAVVISMFTGPWSDKYGRRLPMFVPIIGGIVSTVILIPVVYIDYKFPPEVIVYANLVAGLTGSFMSLLIGFSYISDVSTRENRSMKFMFLEGCIMLGIPTGNFLSGYLHKLYGYGPVYILSTICQVISLAYAIVFMKETRGIGIKDSWKVRLKYFFNLMTMTESFRVCFRERPGRNRMILIFLVLSMLSFVFFVNLENSVLYMYTQLIFKWDQWSFSVFKSSTSFTSLVFTMVVAPILTFILKISDIALGIFGTVSGIISVTIMGLAQSAAFFYIGAFVGLFQSMIPPLLRSCITKVVDPNETGKIFALVTSLEFGTPILASLFYVQIYNNTVHSFPSCSFFMAGFISIWPIITFTLMERFGSQNLQNYQRL